MSRLRPMPPRLLFPTQRLIILDLVEDESSEQEYSDDPRYQESPRPGPQLDRSQFESDQKDQERKESLENSFEV